MRRFLAALVSFVVALNLIWVEPVFANTDYSTIRVSLSSMGTPTSVRIKVEGSYTVAENTSVVLEKKEYRVELTGGSLRLTDGTVSYSLGSRFNLIRGDGQLKVYNNSYGAINYLGNMEVRVVDNYIRFINHIDLETYLYGVVPYEMSNSWPLEALKAQAVAARTYAVKNKRASSYYDVFDTDSSQVYKGYNSSLGNAIKAVNDTSGRVLKYGSGFAGTYYSASNGGMTEAAGNIWPEKLPYTIVTEDPYDISSPVNPHATWTVPISKFPVDISFQNRLKARIKPSLDAKGYSIQDSDINILLINDLSFDPPNNSGRMVTGRISLTAEVKNKADGTISMIEEVVALNQGNMRSILNIKSLLFTVEDTGVISYLHGGGWGHGIGMSQYGARQMATLGMNYAMILEFYYPGTQLSLIYGSTPVEDPDRGGSRPDPTPEPTDFVFPPFPTPEPTDFVFPTPEPTAIPEPTAQPTPTPKPTPAPTPSPTPKPSPTPSPVPAKVQYGKVKVSTKLNVRQGPGSQYGIVGTLKNDTVVVVWEQNGQWFSIQADNMKGYVSKDFVTLTHTGYPPGVEAPAPVQPQPKPDDTGSQTPPTDAVPPDQKKTGVVTATSLNVRSGPGTKNNAMGMIVKGTKITILETSGEWYKIAYNNAQGFVSAQYIQLQQTAENPAKPQTAVVIASSLNVRSGPGTQHGRIGSLSQNSQVSVLETNNGWSKIQQSNLIGFVDNRYLKAAPANQTASRGDTAKSGTVTATTLNVRSGAGTQYKVIGSLLRNNKVEILNVSGQWYNIKFGSTTGYIHSDYLKLQ